MTERADNVSPRLPDLPGLPPETKQTLSELLGKACASLQDDLKSVILYGSAAEGRLRATSDINLLFLLTQFSRDRVDPLREPLRVARALADVQVMFLLASELPAAAAAFAMKFDDIRRRHCVLYGEDPFDSMPISRTAKIERLRQELLNLSIRMRERYASTSLREEQLALALADMTGPLRVAAATIQELQGAPAPSAKAALETVAATMEIPGAQSALSALSTAREQRILPPGVAAETLFTVMEITARLRRIVEEL